MEMVNEYQHLRKVEAEILWWFMWREMIGEKEWFKEGRKELATWINRHEKSVKQALQILEAKNVIVTEKHENKLWVKHTLPIEEVYARLAFIDSRFSVRQSEQELLNDLQREIARIEKEIILTQELNELNQEEDNKIETVLEQITEEDINEFVYNILVKRTYTNINMTPEERIDDALMTFRTEMFEKHV